MACVYLFADESGNLAFKPTGSRFFTLCTLAFACCDVAADLLDLRRRMLLKGVKIGDGFHANSNSWPVRNEVINLLAQHDFRADATILEKRKAHPVARPNEHTFYRYAWYYHAKFVRGNVMGPGDELLVRRLRWIQNRGRPRLKMPSTLSSNKLRGE